MYTLEPVCETVEHEKEIAPTDEFLAPLQMKIRVVTAGREEFLNSHLIGNLLKGFLGVGDRERHENAAGPRRNLVDVEPEPIREQYDFRWNCWHCVVVVLAEEAQIDLGEGVDRSDPAETLDALSRSYQNGIVRLIACELQPKIGLNRSANVRWSTVVDRPAAVFILMAQDLTCGLLQAHFIARSQKGMQQDVIGFEGRVGFELAGPVSFRLLEREEEPSRAVHRRGYAAGDVIDLAKHHLHRATGGFVHGL